MQIQFDPTISLGTVGSIIVFLGGAAFAAFRFGTYTSTLNHLLRRFEDFMQESKDDRARLRARVDMMEERQQKRHEENTAKFVAVFRRFLIPEDYENGDEK